MVSCFGDQDWIPAKHLSVTNAANSCYIPECCLILYKHCYHNHSSFHSQYPESNSQFLKYNTVV